MTTNNVATEILNQLGGNRFLAMTGAQVMGDGNALIIKLPRISKASAFKVTLDLATDTYIAQVYRGRGMKIKAHGGPIYQLHAEDLAGVFTEATGLVTTL